MSSNEYLDSLMNELAQEGVVPAGENNKEKLNEAVSLEESVIRQMENITGRKFSNEQRRILEHHGNACILACAGSGKALVNGTGVLTPEGYVNIEALKVGSVVCGIDGTSQYVLGVFPQGKKKVYKVKFTDNNVIQCCSEHLWAYKKSKDSENYTVDTLDNIYTSMKKDNIEVYTPVCKPVHFSLREENRYLPIEPYLFGVLTAKLNSAKERSLLSIEFEMDSNIEKIDNQLRKVDAYLEKYGNTYRIALYSNKLELRLQTLGNAKQIPDIYKYNSIEDREELLQGVIDTVGYTRGDLTKIELNKVKVLEDLQFIAETLGYVSSTYDNRVYIHRTTDRRVLEIEETDDYEEMTCIKVSGGSELFLTEHCIVTHNTTISVNLIAKRIMTGEIRDVNKLIYTTYSKAGATEMKERMDNLLKQLGMGHINVQVRTIHSFFLQVLRIFGVNSNIIKAAERSKLIKQACKDANFTPKDDELMLVDNLLSYQINNLLNDKKTIESSVNTLENLTLEQYSKIRKSYADQKNAKGLIDYDDMQSFLYLWLVKCARSEDKQQQDLAKSVRDYCKAMWTDFYIDEAQDVSKIQFEIIRAMVADPNDLNKLDKNLVFIGDDDQCLLENTLIKTADGLDKPIKDIQVGEKVLSLDDGKIVKSTVLSKYEHDIHNNIPLVKIITASGREMVCTADHKVMVKIPDRFRDNTFKNADGNNEYVVTDWLNNGEKDKIQGIINKDTSKLSLFGYIEELPHFGKDVKTQGEYTITSALSLSSGMIFGRLVDNECKVIDDEIVAIESVNKQRYDIRDKKVYCLNLVNNHNYFANGLLTHNCIYQWRGSDPSIILTISAKFDIPTFVLSTNYRCYNEIVDYAANGVKCNNSRYNKSMNANMTGGTVKILPLPKNREDLCNLSIAAMNHIKWWLQQGHKLSDIAVLSRNNFHLALLSNMLLREGIYCNMTDDMKLTKSYMYKDVKDIIDISEPSWKPETTSRILWRLCRYMGVGNARVIADFQNNCALSLQDTLGWLIKRFVYKDLDFDKKLSVPLQMEQRLQYFVGKFSKETLDDLVTIYETLGSSNRQERIETLLKQYLEASSFMYKSKDRNRSIVGLVKYIYNLMKKDGVDKMLEFLRVTEQLENGKMVIPGEKLTLTTIHSAKGREWRDVIMFACDNVSQPSFDGIYNMLDKDIAISDIYSNIDEERRLFYVGNTRAKENLLVLTYEEPSIFILEALGMFNGCGGNNSTIIDLVNSETSLNSVYSKFIEDYITNPNSKYYYNAEDYKLTQ